jgi:lipopolysaccharide transport system permease protein
MNLLGRPWQHLYQQRRLIQLMAKRDIVGRYKGSFAGLLWTIVNPLALLFIYWFVFSVIFRVRFGADGKPINFVLYVVAGLLPWIAFSEALARSNTCVVENPNLVKKVVFPLEVLPVNCAFASCFNSLVGILALILLASGIRGGIPWTVFLLPLIILPQLLLTAGIGWLLASLGVFIRDINHVISLVLTIWMFVTPIVYPETLVPSALRPILRLNPFTAVVNSYRNVLLDGTLPAAGQWLYLLVVSLVMFFVGFYWFVGTKRAFADVI